MKVGVFDSGLGGLTVLQALRRAFPGCDYLYIADTRYAPYGLRSPEEIRRRVLELADYLIGRRHCDTLVVACNTATSAAISDVRKSYPNRIIVGTEPGIKPALSATRSGAIGVLATPATLKGDKYQELIDSLGARSKVRLYEQACPGLVEAIESGRLDEPQTRRMLEEWLIPMKEAEVDTLVLGCTHYPLAEQAIRRIMGRNLTLVETGEAIARRVGELAAEASCTQGEGELQLLSTGAIDADAVARILGSEEEIRSVRL